MPTATAKQLDPRVIRSGAGGWALDAQWSDDFHHAVHVALTGEITLWRTR